ncbi:MAG: hypothetical protein DI596_05320, partial [Azospira oryzae]
ALRASSGARGEGRAILHGLGNSPLMQSTDGHFATFAQDEAHEREALRRLQSGLKAPSGADGRSDRREGGEVTERGIGAAPSRG